MDVAMGHDLLGALETRRSVDPAFLGEPGPNAADLARILTIAARVPDHGVLEPWRFIVVSGEARAAASAALQAAYRAHTYAGFRVDNPGKAEKTLATMGVYFTRAPLAVVVVSRADPAGPKPEWDQILVSGAVCMNLITAATALGYGADWLTGWPAYDPAAHAVLGVAAGERVAGIIHLGTATRATPERRRPDLGTMVTRWAAG